MIRVTIIASKKYYPPNDPNISKQAMSPEQQLTWRLAHAIPGHMQQDQRSLRQSITAADVEVDMRCFHVGGVNVPDLRVELRLPRRSFRGWLRSCWHWLHRPFWPGRRRAVRHQMEQLVEGWIKRHAHQSYPERAVDVLFGPVQGYIHRPEQDKIRW